MPQRTGTFTLPALEFPYFDPRRREYDVTRTDPVTITVEAGAGGVASGGASTPSPSQDAANEQKNVLTASGLRPLRYQARFVEPVDAAVGAGLLPARGAGAGGAAVRGDVGGAGARAAAHADRGGPQEAAGEGRAQAAGRGGEAGGRAQRQRLLRRGGEGAAWASWRRGCTCPWWASPARRWARRWRRREWTPERRSRVLFVLEACDMGRFGGGAELSERNRVLDEAEAVMEGWEK